MHVEHLRHPFDIHFLRSDECPLRDHKHSFFELVYIVSGEGNHVINGNKLRYYPDNLFLLSPMEVHYFEVESTTSFIFICFNNIYLKGQLLKDERNPLGHWVQKLEYIFQSSHDQGCVIRNTRDKALVTAVMSAIIQEYENEQNLQKELMQQLVNTLITVVARNISRDYTDKSVENDNLALKIIHYIHLHIYDTEKLKAEHIAAHFNISLNYIGEYFKKQTAENLQQYIINYKLSLVEARLRYSDMRLHEIAFELGFTDESHLTKTFKKHKGMTPTLFRKNSLVQAAG